MAGKWIEAGEEKPDADLIVLVAIPNSCEPVWLGYWDDENQAWFTEDGMEATVTHWMELPEVPSSE